MDIENSEELYRFMYSLGIEDFLDNEDINDFDRYTLEHLIQEYHEEDYEGEKFEEMLKEIDQEHLDIFDDSDYTEIRARIDFIHELYRNDKEALEYFAKLYKSDEDVEDVLAQDVTDEKEDSRSGKEILDQEWEEITEDRVSEEEVEDIRESVEQENKELQESEADQDMESNDRSYEPVEDDEKSFNERIGDFLDKDPEGADDSTVKESIEKVSEEDESDE